MDLATAQAQLNEALTALSAARKNQSWNHGERAQSLQALNSHQEDVRFWSKEVARLTRGGPSVSRMTLHG